jgi:hypothetical protein
MTEEAQIIVKYENNHLSPRLLPADPFTIIYIIQELPQHHPR